jgi:hypothetical protein
LPRIGGNRRMGSRSGAEEHRSSALPAAIARPGDFAPTSASSGRLLSRNSPFAPVRRDAGREGVRHRPATSTGRPAARLQGNTAGRVVRHRASAKRGDVHQPEAPSIPRPSENERRSFAARRAERDRHQRLFHRPGTEQEDACSDPDGSTDRRG